MAKTTIETHEEICSLCVGSGTLLEYPYPPHETTTAGPFSVQCRQCGGRGFVVTKRVIR